MANPILQLLEALRNMFTCDIGIDLGTANTLVYMKGRGIIIREPSVVAVDARTDELRVRCVGHEAKAIIGAAPNSILAVRPLKDGVIADFDITAAMLYRAMTNIINFIQAMDYVVPGFAAYETLLYSPELKFYSNRVKMDTDFNTSLQGLHCLGDSSGWTRGLMMASVMGTLMGRKIAEEG